MPKSEDKPGGSFVSQGTGSMAPPAFYAQHQEDWTARALDNLRLFGVQLACAGGSAAVAKTAVAPLERVKILLQVQPLLVRAGEGPAGGGGGGGAAAATTSSAGAASAAAPPSRGATAAAAGPAAAESGTSSSSSSSSGSAATSSAARAARRSRALPSPAAAATTAARAAAAAAPTSSWRAALGTAATTTTAAAAAAAAPVPRPPLPPHHLPYAGLLDALRRVPSCEGGWTALYRGNGANVLRLVPEVALRFAVADQFRIMLGPADGSPPGARERAAAAAAAGALRTLLLYPLDVARTRIAADVGGGPAAAAVGGGGGGGGGGAAGAAGAARASSAAPSIVPRSYTGIGQALASTWRAEGRRGLYRGLAPSLAGSAVYTAAALTAYDELRAALPPDRASRASFWYPLLQVGAGAGAGVVAQTLAYPLDTVRRRMQVARAAGSCWGAGAGSVAAAHPAAAALRAAAVGGGGAPGGPSSGPYRGAFDCALRMLRHEGPRSLVRGVGVNAIKTAPGAAVQFLAYDAFKVAVAWVDPTSGATSPL